PGSHTLVTEIYTAAGTKLGQDTIDFTILTGGSPPPAVGERKSVVEGTNQKIIEILDVSSIDNALFAGKSITIVGEGTGESFKFNFDNGTVTRTESIPPYALMADVNGDLLGGLTLNPGSHTLVTEIYSADNGAGTKLGQDTIDFTILTGGSPPPAVGRYWIADAGTDQKIVEILDGSSIDDALFAGKSITIVGEGPGESFKFNFDNGTVLFLGNRPSTPALHRRDHLDLRLAHRTIPRISPMTCDSASYRQCGLHRTRTPLLRSCGRTQVAAHLHRTSSIDWS